MTFPDLTYKLNNELLPKIGVTDIVITPDDIYELADLLRSNVGLHQVVSKERGLFIEEMCVAIELLVGIIDNRQGDMKDGEIKAVKRSTLEIILKARAIAGDLAYTIAAKEMSEEEHPLYTNKFSNKKFS